MIRESERERKQENMRVKWRDNEKARERGGLTFWRRITGLSQASPLQCFAKSISEVLHEQDFHIMIWSTFDTWVNFISKEVFDNSGDI